MHKKELKEFINLFNKNIKIIERRLEIQYGNLVSKKDTIKNFKETIRTNSNEKQIKTLEEINNAINLSIKKNKNYNNKLIQTKKEFDLLHSDNNSNIDIENTIKKIHDDILYLTEQLKIETIKDSKRSTEIQKLFQNIIKI